jgi:hypothetical protein
MNHKQRAGKVKVLKDKRQGNTAGPDSCMVVYEKKREKAIAGQYETRETDAQWLSKSLKIDEVLTALAPSRALLPIGGTSHDLPRRGNLDD